MSRALRKRGIGGAMNYNWNWGIFWEMSADGRHTWTMTLIHGPGLDAGHCVLRGDHRASSWARRSA